MVLGVFLRAVSGPIAVAVGSKSVASATGNGAVAVATAGETVTVVAGAAAEAGANAATSGGNSTAGEIADMIGWVTLGCTSQDRSWDCWKPIVRDTSTEPSTGRPLSQIVLDRRVKDARIDQFGQLYLMNIWDEMYRIDYVQVDEKLAAHATRC